MTYIDHVGKLINAKVVFLGAAPTLERAEALHRQLAIEAPIERLELEEGPIALFQFTVPGVWGYQLCLHLFWFDGSRADDETLALILRGAEGLVLDGLHAAVRARARALYEADTVEELEHGADTNGALRRVASAMLAQLEQGSDDEAAPTREGGSSRERPPDFNLGGFRFVVTGVFDRTELTDTTFTAYAPEGVVMHVVLLEGGGGDLDGWSRAQRGKRSETTLASHRVVGVRAGDSERYAADVAGDRLEFTMVIPGGAAPVAPMRRLVFSMVEGAIIHRTS